MKILLAEDEVQMSRAETAFLTMKGYQVDVAADGEQAVALARANAYDVMVLDIMMPRMDGIQALQTLRACGNTTPVILLTAKAELDDRIEGLTAGADDYLTKPFSLRELEARIASQIRRAEQFAPRLLVYRNITLHAGEQELSCRNAIRLAGKESKLLAFLMRNPDRTLSGAELLRHVWDEQEQADEDTVYLYISYLRQKLRAVDADAEIRGTREAGYILCAVEDAP